MRRIGTKENRFCILLWKIKKINKYTNKICIFYKQFKNKQHIINDYSRLK